VRIEGLRWAVFGGAAAAVAAFAGGVIWSAALATATVFAAWRKAPARRLREPLGLAVACLGLVREGYANGSAEVAACLDSALAAAARLGAGTGDVDLAAARAVAQLPLHRGSHRVDGLFAAARRLLGPRARARRIGLDFAGDAGLAVHTDARRFLQVVAHLASRGLAAAGAGGSVRIAAVARGPVVRFRVASRSHAVHARPTGEAPCDAVGRCVLRRLVERLGGRLGRGAGRGPGAAQWFELPRGDPAVAPAGPGIMMRG